MFIMSDVNKVFKSLRKYNKEKKINHTTVNSEKFFSRLALNI